jgi:hypothetical protein
MKLFWFVFITGFVLLFFLINAFKIDVFSWEMVTHILYHFFIGFAIFFYFFSHMTLKSMKFLLILVLGLLILDEIFDYSRGVGKISLMILIANFYMVLWGGLSGFTYARCRRKKGI